MTPLKDTERAWRDSEAWRRRMHDVWDAVTTQTAVLVAAIDLDFCYTFFNAAYREEIKRLTGQDIELGTSLLAAFDQLPEQQAIAKVHWSRALQGESRHDHLEFGEPGRYRRCYQVHQTPLRDAEGQIVGAGVVAFDITPQRLAEQALQQSQQQWSRAFEGIQELMAVWEVVRNSQGEIIERRLREANRTFLQAAQVASLEAIRGKTVGQIFGAAAVEPNLTFIRQAMAAGTPQTFEGELNGRSYLITLGPLDEQCYLTTGRDITIIKQAEAARHASEARYRALFERMTEGFALHEIITDDHGQPCDYRFLELNPAFERLTGLKHDNTLGKRVREVLPDLEPYWIEQYGNVALTGEAVHFERFVPPLNRWYEVYAYQPAARQFAVIFTDSTPRKQAEEALREADRRKDEFLAMLAHELRNPLAPIRSAVQILNRLGPVDPKQQWARDVIARQVKHLARLVDDLLDSARLIRGQILLQKEPIELATLLQQAVDAAQPLLTARQHQFHLTRPHSPVWLEGDPVRLVQVLLNLLDNAAKYTEPGGRIDLEAECRGAEVAVRVRDTGPGLSPALLSRAFELFEQGERTLDRAQGGLGIGLTLVRRLVELHGGRVEAHSAGPAQGAEFTVWLPARSPSVVPAEAMGSLPAARPTPNRRVLLVDDDPDVVESLTLWLQLEGFEVTAATTGQAALELADAFQPQVVLLDLGMPGMNGYEIARRLHERPLDQQPWRLIALTGYSDEETRRRVQEAGFTQQLVKPVEPDVLLTVLRTEA